MPFANFRQLLALRRRAAEVMGSAEYAAITAAAEPIKRDRFGVKVWRLQDGSYLKLFRPKHKKWFSSERLVPANARFAFNAHQLINRGIATVDVKRLCFCASVERHAVHYDPLEGETMEDLLLQLKDPNLLPAFARFMAMLHDAGILFRSLHLGNVVRQPNGELGLIDVHAITFERGSLNAQARSRNFRHLLRNGRQAELMNRFGSDLFWQAYFETTQIKRRPAIRLKSQVQPLINS